MDDLEFTAALAEVSTEPVGYLTRATPGWQHFTVRIPGTPDWPASVDNSPVTVGANLYPEFFELEITKGEVGDPDELELYLAWQFLGDDFEHVGTLSLAGDERSALERILSLKPLQFWRRKSLMHLAFFGGKDGFQITGPDHSWSEAEIVAAHRRARRALATPTGGRKDRVTAAVLQEVAEVYRAAWKAGRNPTQSVAEHFHKSHSTAARWVGQARKIGALGPANGSLGGEIEPEGASDE